jgi:hypothetical protein
VFGPSSQPLALNGAHFSPLCCFWLTAASDGAEKWRQFYDGAVAKAANRDVAGALDDLNQSLEANPRAVLAANYRGQLKQFQGDLEGALADYYLATRIDSR